MLPIRIARASPMRQTALAATRRMMPTMQVQMQQRRTYIPESVNSRELIDKHFPDPPSLTEAEDPFQNGAMNMPLPVKRQFRDPHGDWWDKQERRNYGEPVHEDYDQMGLFTPYEYTWTTPGKGLVQIGTFVSIVFAVYYIVTLTAPDRPFTQRTWDDGLVKELGGRGTMIARTPESEEEADEE